jgi:hypothetical protein
LEKARQHPLVAILICALALRLVAAVFSTGYAMHDDHFVIEDGPFQWELVNYGGWFDRDEPPGHSVVYPAALYSVLESCRAVGVGEPTDQMLVMRILHALWSVAALPFLWWTVHRLTNERTAIWASFAYACLWFMPFMSVRCLIEMVAIPPLMAALWFTIRDRSRYDLLWAGLAFALAFCFRYQTAIVALGVAIGMVVLGRRYQAVVLTLACIVAATLTQGVADLLAWGSLFAGPIAYVKGTFTTDPSLPASSPLMYPALLLAIFIPPVSLLLLATVGLIRDRRIHCLITLPTLLFLLVHMIIPNRQERFLLPVIGMVIILVAIGYSSWLDRGLWSRVTKWSITYAVVINFVLLVLMTTSSSKAARIEAMTTVRNLNARSVLTVRHPNVHVPRFYAGHDIQMTSCFESDTLCLQQQLSDASLTHVVCFGSEADAIVRYLTRSGGPWPLQKVRTIEASGLDRLLYMMNPAGNRNESATIYEVDR